MRYLRNLALVLFAATLIAATLPTRADAQVSIGISLGFGPPPIPDYYQPPPPAPDVIWQPGYWAWGPYGYYWVPGTWVAAPEVGFLWTPGYWNFTAGFYRWDPGYWGPHIGYYGGINYGFGYYGNGYVGGGWYGRHFRYNTAVTTVNTTIVRNVYYNRTVVNNTWNRVSYRGGNGVRSYPTADQVSYTRERHVGMTSQQQAHVMQAQSNRNYLASVNHGTPAVAAAAHPFAANSRPTNFAPVRSSDRVTNTRTAPAYHAAPAYQPQSVQHAAPAYHPQAVQHAAPVYHPQSVQHAAPAYHPQSVQHAAPVYHPQSVQRAAPAYHPPVNNHAAAAYHPQSRPAAPRQESAPKPRPSHAPRG